MFFILCTSLRRDTYQSERDFDLYQSNVFGLAWSLVIHFLPVIVLKNYDYQINASIVKDMKWKLATIECQVP